MRLAVVLRLVVLLAMILCVRLIPNLSSKPARGAQSRTIDVLVKELKVEHGPPPIAVRCEAPLVTENELGSLKCTIKNNTVKKITGICLDYTTVVENSDGEIRDTHSWAINTLLHPDFQSTQRPLAPRAETTLNAAAVSFNSPLPKVIEVTVDYVEFENGSGLGPNLEGSRILADMRLGARLYKQWLVQEHLKRGKSTVALEHLIQTSDPNLPYELEGLQSKPNQEQGAKAYRTLIKRLWDKRGASEVMKHFPQ